jgi:hypothetical protein
MDNLNFTFSMLRFGRLFILAAVTAIVLIVVLRRKKEDAANNAAPVQNVQARIISKRTETEGMAGMEYGGMLTTKHYVTFEAPDGSRLELPVQGDQYGMLAEGDTGVLAFQGTRYLNFERKLEIPEQTEKRFIDL